jgi:signal transduction histidine kinase
MEEPVPFDSSPSLLNARLANQLRLLTRVHPLMEHNLRGLLNGISLNVSLLELTLPAAQRGDATAQAQVKAALSGLRQEVDRSAAKLAGLVQATAPQMAAEPELFDLRGLLGEVTELLSLEVRRLGGRLSLELPAQPVLWEGRRDQVRQVLLNMAVDLLESIPKKETMTVTLKVQDARAEIAMVAARMAPEESCSPPSLCDWAVARELVAEVGGELRPDDVSPSQKGWLLLLPLSST